MGYYSDFSGNITVTCRSDAAAAALAEVLADKDGPCWFAPSPLVVCSTVMVGIDLYERWYDCESDIEGFVCWLGTQAIVERVDGEVRVSGEDDDDRWRLTVKDGAVLRTEGQAASEGKDERAEDVVRDIVAGIVGADSPYREEIERDAQRLFAERVRRAR